MSRWTFENRDEAVSQILTEYVKCQDELRKVEWLLLWLARVRPPKQPIHKESCSCTYCENYKNLELLLNKYAVTLNDSRSQTHL